MPPYQQPVSFQQGTYRRSTTMGLPPRALLPAPPPAAEVERERRWSLYGLGAGAGLALVLWLCWSPGVAHRPERAYLPEEYPRPLDAKPSLPVARVKPIERDPGLIPSGNPDPTPAPVANPPTPVPSPTPTPTPPGNSTPGAGTDPNPVTVVAVAPPTSNPWDALLNPSPNTSRPNPAATANPAAASAALAAAITAVLGRAVDWSASVASSGTDGFVVPHPGQGPSKLVCQTVHQRGSEQLTHRLEAQISRSDTSIEAWAITLDGSSLPGRVRIATVAGVLAANSSLGSPVADALLLEATRDCLLLGRIRPGTLRAGAPLRIEGSSLGGWQVVQVAADHALAARSSLVGVAYPQQNGQWDDIGLRLDGDSGHLLLSRTVGSLLGSAAGMRRTTLELP